MDLVISFHLMVLVFMGCSVILFDGKCEFSSSQRDRERVRKKSQRIGAFEGPFICI
jgi:hypothetical protein